MNRIAFLDNLHHTAVTDGKRTSIVYNSGLNTLNYAELDRLSSAITDKLSRSGINPKDTISVMMHRDAFSIAAELGVLKAGLGILVLSSMIAFSRMYLFVHFPCDVLFGILIGILSGFIAANAIKRA